MAGLVPAIHVSPLGAKNVDARDKPGHDDLRGER
jgi:acyl-CoA dehydrogenase